MPLDLLRRLGIGPTPTPRGHWPLRWSNVSRAELDMLNDEDAAISRAARHRVDDLADVAEAIARLRRRK